MTVRVTETPPPPPSPTPEAAPQPQAPRDAELLRRYVLLRDEAAFAELVERYSRLVMGVCRRVLQREHDVEDAFQATFLVLARDAARVRKRASLASWLHGVAYRTSLRAVDSTLRRGRLLRDVTMMPEPIDNSTENGPFAQVEDRHQRQALDEELVSLPEKYQAPLVLHYLDGKSNQQVADELGLTVTAVEGRLKRGRKELRLRLARRGIGLSVAVAAMQAVQSAAEAAPWNTLIARTIDAGLSYGGGAPAGPAYTPEAARLAGQELATMSTTTAATLAAIFLVPFALTLAGHGTAPGAGTVHLAVESVVGQAPAIDGTAISKVEQEEANDREVEFEMQAGATLIPLNDVGDFRLTVSESGRLELRYRLPDGSRQVLMGEQIELLTNAAGEKVAVVSQATNATAKRSDGDGRRAAQPLTRADRFAEFGSMVSSREAIHGFPLQQAIHFQATSPNVQRIQAQLQTDTSIEFVDTPLSDAVDYLAQFHNITILIEVGALEDAGIPTDEPITLTLQQVRLQSALDLMLRRLGLTTIIRDEVLMITTKEKAEEFMEARVYDTRGFIEASQLLDVLQTAVPDAPWEDIDGFGGTLSAVEGALIVMQSQAVHDKIADLLSQLRRHHAQPTGPAGEPLSSQPASHGGSEGVDRSATLKALPSRGRSRSTESAPAQDAAKLLPRTLSDREDAAGKSAPRTAPPEESLRLVIYSIKDIPVTNRGDGFGGESYSTSTIANILQQSAASVSARSSLQLIDEDNLAVFTSDAGHDALEQSLKTLREYFSQRSGESESRGDGAAVGEESEVSPDAATEE